MYPNDRIKMAIHIYTILHSLRKTAKLLQVSHSTISRWINNPIRKKYTTKRVLKADLIVDIIKSTISLNPFISINKLKILIKETLTINVSKELIRIAIIRMKYTKKNARFYGQPKNLPDKVKEFIFLRNKYIEDGKEFICIDETSFGRHKQPIKGYSRKGERLMIKKKLPRITTTTSIVAIDKTNIVKRINFTGSCNTLKFLDFIKSINFEKKHIILMDNVRFHHSNIIKEYCKDNNIDILYTPPYSPWFNPIELCFSIIKRQFYKDKSIDTSFNYLRSEMINSFYNKSVNCLEAF